MKHMIAFMLFISLFTGIFVIAEARQTGPLAKIRVDDSGNIEILENNISTNMDAAVQTLRINPEKSGYTNSPASPMTLLDLEFVTSACSCDFIFLNITFDIRITNTGTDPTGTFSIGYYLSANQNFSPGERIYHHTQASIAGGTTVDVHREIDEYDGELHYYPGVWYVGCILDVFSNVAESDENNNTLVLLNKLSIPEIPDLTVSGHLYNNNGPIIDYEMDIQNHGTETSDPCIVAVFLSADQIIDPSDDLLLEQPCSSVGRGWYAEYFPTADLTGKSEGEYYMLLKVDYYNVVDEYYEDNNERVATHRYTSDPIITIYPDLVVSLIQLPDDEGPEITYVIDVMNIGEAATSGNFKNTIYDFNELIDESDDNNNEGYAASPKVMIGSSGVDNELIPTEFDLKAAYPNPFNASATIKFDLPESCPVSLKIYSPTGQHITTLVNEIRSAGVYPVVWNAEDLPSGMYIYQLKSGSLTETRKLILQKQLLLRRKYPIRSPGISIPGV